MKKVILFLIFVFIFLSGIFYFWQKGQINKTKLEATNEISCAKEGEKVSRNFLLGQKAQKCCSGLIEWRESESYSYCLKPNPKGILIESPKENEKVKNPLKIKGQATGSWFFEAEFLAELYDVNDNFLGRAILKAKGDWMTEDLVPFEGILEYSQPEVPLGKLRFLSSNPSGLPENQKIFEIPVKF